MAALPVDSTIVKPRPAKILVIDDDVAIGDLVTRLLEVAGYAVDHVLDPLKALPLLRGDDYALVLLEHNMPGMDGIALLEEIRKSSAVPVVMLTGSDSSKLAVRAIRLGAFDYMTKPVEELKLIDTVRQAIASGPGAGDRIAHYEIEREIGRGGMGVVYAARDPRLDRRVALKVLLPEIAADPAYETKFLAEARNAAKFSHPNIVVVYQAGRFRGRLFMAMEFVEGELLETAIRAGKPLPLGTALDIGLQTAGALEAMHAAGMAHRDLKPANLIVTANALVKILDFGLVHPLPTVGSAPREEDPDYSGTLAYAPPELLDRGQSDARGDIYALGVVLYELLSGVRAFESRLMTDLMRRILESRPAIPFSEYRAAPPDVVAVLQKLMARNPEERYATITEARIALRNLRRRGGPPHSGTTVTRDR